MPSADVSCLADREFAMRSAKSCVLSVGLLSFWGLWRHLPRAASVQATACIHCFSEMVLPAMLHDLYCLLAPISAQKRHTKLLQN